MDLLELFGTRTLLYPRTKRLVEEVDRKILSYIIKWRMFSANNTIEIEDYFGKQIKYSGIRFGGSSEKVFHHFFPPFFDHEIPKILEQTKNICIEQKLDPQEYLNEIGDLSLVMVVRLWKEIHKTYQILKSDGFKQSQDVLNVDSIREGYRRKINEEIQALLVSKDNTVEKTKLLSKIIIFLKKYKIVGFLVSFATIGSFLLALFQPSSNSQNINIGNNSNSPIIQNHTGNIIYNIKNFKYSYPEEVNKKELIKKLDLEFKLFFEHFYDQFLEPSKDSLSEISNAISLLGNFDDVLQPLVITDEEKELLKKDVANVYLKKYLSEFEYESQIGISRDNFEFFKKYINEALILNPSILNNEQDIEKIKQLSNNLNTQIKKLKNKKEISFEEKQKIAQLKSDYFLAVKFRLKDLNLEMTKFINRLKKDFSNNLNNSIQE